MWPDVFCDSSDSLSTTPMMESIVWCLFNTSPDTFSPEMLVDETKRNFEKDYGHKANMVKAEELVIKFIKVAEENVRDEEMLEEVTKSLLLLGRVKEFRWVNNNVYGRLMKKLGEVWTSSQANDQSFLSWVIRTLGILSRVFTAEGRDILLNIYNSG